MGRWRGDRLPTKYKGVPVSGLHTPRDSQNVQGRRGHFNRRGTGSVTHNLKSMDKKTVQTKLLCHMHLYEAIKNPCCFLFPGWGVGEGLVKLLSLCHHISAPLAGYLDVSLMSPSQLPDRSLLVLAGSSVKTRNRQSTAACPSLTEPPLLFPLWFYRAPFRHQSVWARWWNSTVLRKHSQALCPRTNPADLSFHQRDFQGLRLL